MKKNYKRALNVLKLVHEGRNPNLVYYGPHPCQKCDPTGKLGTMIVKAGNGVPNKLQFDFIQDSHYPNHVWLQHKCIDITK